MSASVVPYSERFPLGRCFFNPAIDYLFLGGAFSLVLVGLLVAFSAVGTANDYYKLLLMSALINHAHFAASTVRLYSKKQNFIDMPFITMGLPLLTLGLTVAAVYWPGSLGRWIESVYLTWSPFHYAAQTFGISMIYLFRSGVALSERGRRLLWWSCMLPFATE